MCSDLDSDVSLHQPAAEIETLVHDLSNQIMVIQGNATLLQMSASDSPEMGELVEQILGASQNAVAITRQLSVKAAELNES